MCRQGDVVAQHMVTAVKPGKVAVKQAAYLPEPRAARMVITATPGSFAVVATTEVVHREGENAVGAGDTAVLEIDALSIKVGRGVVPVASVEGVMEVTSYQAQGGRP